MGGLGASRPFLTTNFFTEVSSVVGKNYKRRGTKKKVAICDWLWLPIFFTDVSGVVEKNWSSKRDLAGPTDWNRLAITAKYCSNHSSNCSFLLETYRSVRESRYVIDKAKTRPFTRSKYKSRPCLSVNTRWIFLLVKSNSRTRRIYGLRQITVVFSRGYGQSSKGVNCSMDIYNDLGCCVAIQMV